MRLAIDASRATLAQRSGVEGYSLHIIRGLLEYGGGHEFILYFRDPPEKNLFKITDNVTVRVLDQRRLWTHKALRNALLADNPDLIFIPGHVVPWPDTHGIPSVVTIHDLGYKHYPDKHKLSERIYLDWSTRHSANVSRKIIVHTNATRHDLMMLEKIPEEKIEVINAGVDQLFRPVTDQARVLETLRKYNIKRPYILHVGRMEPRKNLNRLVEAFGRLSSDYKELSLVFTGRYNPDYRAFTQSVSKLSEPSRVILTGYVPDIDLPALYSGAEVYVFPSLYEGFGFPAIEAMACGTPVVCSNTSSLPELVGDSAITVAPTDVSGFEKAISLVLSDPSLSEELISQGLRRAATYTWEQCAKKTLGVLNSAVMNA